MPKKQKLELTWIGKENRPKLEPRILIEDPDKSHHANNRVSEDDFFENKLIHGDNLLALKALEQQYTGKVKCIYIDPPYNTGSAFDHYEDGIEHSIWLSLIRDRLIILQKLLSNEGSIWISIDDNELAYLRILCDEVFGRSNFICNVIWQKVYTIKNSARYFSDMHDYILVYAKNIETWNRNDLPRTDKQDKAYKNPDKDPRGPWKATPIQARNFYSKGLYSMTSPSGKTIPGPPKGTYWRISEENFKKLDDDNRIWWGNSGNNVPAQKRFLTEVKSGVAPSTMWFYDEVGHNAEAKNELRSVLEGIEDDLFITPKPERLIQRILHVASNKGDIVLDSFLGSGTTAAVAHKMGRRWIGIELGEHCYSHCIPRLKRVVDNEDQGGISKNVKWKGGGGFRFYELGPSLIKKDEWGNSVINPEFKPEMLAEAMCKLEGFNYQPSEEAYWIHGHSSESDFIYVTTQFMSREMLTRIADEVGSERSLLICCTAFRCNPADFSNLTVKKIPKAVLRKCEWDHDDYSLEIKNLPDAPPLQGENNEEKPKKSVRKFGKGGEKKTNQTPDQLTF